MLHNAESILMGAGSEVARAPTTTKLYRCAAGWTSARISSV